MKKVLLITVLLIAALTGCAPASATQAPAPEVASSSSGSPYTFTINSAESEARFVIDEVLNGAPKTVVGATNAVSGGLTPDFANPANTMVGTIRIDVSTLETDSGMRNRAIRDMILNTSANQYAEFTPTSLSGLPASITIGQPFTFQITGNLVIKGTSREVTFDVTATPVSETRIEALATLADVNYADWGVSILRLPPQVASVEELVTLELEFVAEAQS